MITLKSPREIKEMQKSGQILAGMHIGLRDIIKPGISSWEIEKFARKYFKEHDEYKSGNYIYKIEESELQ